MFWVTEIQMKFAWGWLVAWGPFVPIVVVGCERALPAA
jgi:hypothetical protein